MLNRFFVKLTKWLFFQVCGMKKVYVRYRHMYMFVDILYNQNKKPVFSNVIPKSSAHVKTERLIYSYSPAYFTISSLLEWCYVQNLHKIMRIQWWLKLYAWRCDSILTNRFFVQYIHSNSCVLAHILSALNRLDLLGSLFSLSSAQKQIKLNKTMCLV